MIKHRILATAAAAVMFVYYLLCGIITTIFPEFSFRMYALAFHGIKLIDLQATALTILEMLVGATFYAVMTWLLVCSVGWFYTKLIKK